MNTNLRKWLRQSLMSITVLAGLGACAGDSLGVDGKAAGSAREIAPLATALAVAPDLGSCGNLQVEEGHQLITKLYARGVQIYRWDGTAWIFVAPSAKLYADAGYTAEIGTHYAGPTWQSISGSKVVGAVDRRCTPDVTAIQWLRLGAVSSTGPGLFDGTSFIQRINTVGGLAPTQPGTIVGAMTGVPYTTDYLFYRKL